MTALCALSTLLTLSTSGCSSDSPQNGPGCNLEAPAEAGAPGDSCSVVPTTVTGLAQTHIPACSTFNYPDNPPAGGPHYPIWAAYKSYTFPVPRGFWVHDLEHGAVVFSYNCCASSAGCADEVARVQALIDAMPEDPTCSAPVSRRVVLTPDPLLDVRWGVSAWGFTLRADCVDEQLFREFYLNHYGHGPEDLCGDGTDFGGTPPCQ